MSKTKQVRCEREVCKEVAARVWCDQDMQHYIMDPKAAGKIAKIIERVRADQVLPRVTYLT